MGLLKSIFLIVLVFAMTGCSNDERDSICGEYKIDKYVSVDTTLRVKNKIQASYSWTFEISPDKLFVLKNDDLIKAKGKWRTGNSVNGNQFIKFESNESQTTARLRGNILYFETPCFLLDSIFSRVVFVKLNTAFRN